MHRIAPIVILTLCAFAAAGTGHAAMSIYMTPEDLAARSDVVVRGTVVSVDSGFDPNTGRLATYVRLDVDTVLRGPSDLTTLVVREPGGTFGELAHHVDAVPDFRAEETVVVFLQAAPDGSLRTTGMFFGKFTIDRDAAVRDLDGRGRIQGRPTARPERFTPHDLTATVVTTPSRGVRPWRAEPSELSRVLWDRPSSAPGIDAFAGGGDDPVRIGVRQDGGAPASPDFTTLSSSSPTRWYGVDSGGTVTFDIQPGGNPLADEPAAVDAIVRAMNAWNDVPESRVVLAPGNVDALFTIPDSSSPASSYPPGNIVLFDDPYDDISDPNGCSGVLAIGGYWRSGSQGATINGQVFHPALRGYVIFNNDFSCFLGDPDDLAEVAAHELGHALGFGHSTVPDAIMRSTAYGAGRGPRLDDDDRDAAHCIYPHVVDVIAPNGGGTVTIGEAVDVTWSVTGESGADPGTVDVLHSADGGSNWATIASGTFNDGHYTWSAQGTPGADHRIRIDRPNRVSPTPAPFPSSCSGDSSDAGFTLAEPAPQAGQVPDGSSGAPLTVARAGPDLVLSWGPSCTGETTSYAIYEGSLVALRSGVWTPSSLTCAASTTRTEIVTPGPDDTYYLIAPLAGGVEGGLGFDGGGVARGLPEVTCAPRETVTTCP